MIPLLDVTQLSEALQTSERSVYRMVSRGAIPYFRLSGRERGPLRFDLHRVLDALEVDPTRADAALESAAS